MINAVPSLMASVVAANSAILQEHQNCKGSDDWIKEWDSEVMDEQHKKGDKDE